MATVKPSHGIAPCLWFDQNGEEAAKFYCSVFPNSSIDKVAHYPKTALIDMHKGMEGKVLSVLFRLNGQDFMALNGGPIFKFSEAISLMVYCETQDEIDYYWDRLCEGGEPNVCGWLKDKYGLSWQVVPKVLLTMMTDPERAPRVMDAFMKMRKFDLAELKRAFEGK